MNKVLSKLFIGLFLVGLVGLTSCGDDKDKDKEEESSISQPIVNIT